mgnify:CR=1 FL=1
MAGRISEALDCSRRLGGLTVDAGRRSTSRVGAGTRRQGYSNATADNLPQPTMGQRATTKFERQDSRLSHVQELCVRWNRMEYGTLTLRRLAECKVCRLQSADALQTPAAACLLPGKLAEAIEQCGELCGPELLQLVDHDLIIGH